MNPRENLSQRIRQLLDEKINNYKDIVVENTDLYFKLSKLIKTKTENGSLEISMALLSRLDDIIEDIVTSNIEMKSLQYAINNNLQITMSVREDERNQRNQSIQRNNLLPLLFLLLTNVDNQNQ